MKREREVKHTKREEVSCERDVEWPTLKIPEGDSSHGGDIGEELTMGWLPGGVCMTKCLLDVGFGGWRMLVCVFCVRRVFVSVSRRFRYFLSPPPKKNK